MPTPTDSAAGRTLAGAALARIEEAGTGRVRVEDDATVPGAIAGEAALVAARLFDIETTAVTPGSAVCGDAINVRLSGDTVDLAAAPIDSAIGILVSALVPQVAPLDALGSQPRRSCRRRAARFAGGRGGGLRREDVSGRAHRLDGTSATVHGGGVSPTPLPEPGPVTNLGRLVQPADANENGTLFGGEAMRLMDEAAAVAAIRYARGSVVTAHVDAIDFHAPVPIGTFLEASARVVAVGRTSMVVEVVLEAEDRRTASRTVTTTGRFVMVAMDEAGCPRPLE